MHPLRPRRISELLIEGTTVALAAVICSWMIARGLYENWKRPRPPEW